MRRWWKNRKQKKEINRCVREYGQRLREEEKSEDTISQYTRQVEEFLEYARKHAPEEHLTKCFVRRYKEELVEQYALATTNTIIASLNGFFRYIQRTDLMLESLRKQTNAFSSENQELTKEEMERLVEAAKEMGDEQIALVIQTLAGTGIRVSELKYITVEAVRLGEANVTLKRKTRKILMPEKLMEYLEDYAREQGIQSGAIFIGKNDKPLDRACIWRRMKKLSQPAHVNPEKVYPHNLRHLFARSFYEKHKDIVKLADMLGHSSINTTKLYTLTTSAAHRKCLNDLGLIS